MATTSSTGTDPRLLLLSDADNVLVVRTAIEAGEEITVEGMTVTVSANVSLGHKIARRTVATDEMIVKYGAPIGVATSDIAIGAHVHVHNVRSDYTPTYALAETAGSAGGVK